MINRILEIHSDADSLFGVTSTFLRITTEVICMTEIKMLSNVDSFIGNTMDLRKAIELFEDDVELTLSQEKLIVKNDLLGIKLDPIPNDTLPLLAEIPINLHLYSIEYDLKSLTKAIHYWSKDIVEISINPNGELNIGNMIVFPIQSESPCHCESTKISTKHIKKFIDAFCNYPIIKICISPPSKFIIDDITFYIAPICDEDTTQS